jgi:hypothetical protein
MTPPDGLEDRVVEALEQRGLFGAPMLRRPALRLALAAAAGVALLAFGITIGRFSVESQTPGGTLTGAETDVYALLLFENESYDAPAGAELMSRYSEYSHWVAQARERDQFITGEDLEVSEGWLIQPSQAGPQVEPATTIAENAPLSGVFFIRADNPDHALQLARELPHLMHGGKVLVQRTLPTTSPPR